MRLGLEPTVWCELVENFGELLAHLRKLHSHTRLRGRILARSPRRAV